MRIKLFSTQFDLETKYKVNHRVDLLIESCVNEFFEKYEIEDFYGIHEVDFDISASEGDFEFKFGDQMQLDSGTSIYQYLYLNALDQVNYQEYILHDKKFDFVLSSERLKTYPLRVYVDRIVDALSTYFKTPNLLTVKSGMLKEIESSPCLYEPRSEEHEYLMYLLNQDGIEWLASKDSAYFKESEVFPKWRRLLQKYSLDEFGCLNFKRE